MILPVTEDRDSGPFFAAAAEGRLAYKACTDCNKGIHPPVPFCPYCGGDAEWRDASGNGVAHASTIVSHQIHPDYPTPFTVVVVELAESPEVRLTARLDGAVEVAGGTPMKVRFETLDEGVVIPNWEIA